MSIDKNYYVIAGYDLTGQETDKFDDWKWTDEGEKYLCNQSKRHIQLFDDPMSGEHLYFGYVLANGDEYYFETTKFTIADIADVECIVYSQLVELQELEIITKDPKFKPEFRVIVFEECT